jgi:hypothetical protein
MGIGDFADRAREEIDEQGGVDELKEKGERARDIAEGEGDMGDKAREAMDEFRDQDSGEQQPGGSDEDRDDSSEGY